MGTTELNAIIYAAFFILGFSVSELINALGGVKQLKRIADSQEKFVLWAEKKDKK